MTTVAIMGGLGNQMFQYAFGRAQSLRNNDKLILDLKDYETYTLHAYGLDNLSIDAKEVKTGGPSKVARLLQGLLPLSWRNYVQITSNHFFSEVLSLRGDKYYLGYWQCAKYFDEYADIIRKELSPKYPLEGKNKEIVEMMKNQNAVSLHVRRGDYVTNPDTNKRFGSCDLDYYHRAIDYIESRIEDTIYYIFTNDVDWVRENFALRSMVVVDWNGIEKNYEDIRLMSHCKHHIIANSSFSWWGAWLNPDKEKIVLAPEIWLVNGSDDAKDLLLPEWIKI